ncbi:hypothetical protein DFQ27_009655 [Actinomortierella ambigua]|uniref:Kelch repeat-containing protein n=1 Tax=Actinomortierella ambigua TaxID=1343610 RepID=A0A9P6PPJ8_9FUNG|nr:hypothetical protein DFQ27_009655 [Actinomortierella ambigua]
MKTQFLRKSLLFVAVATISTAQQGPVAPRPVAKASYAKHHNKLYVYGGRETQEVGSGQFFVLDLSKQWKSAQPAWSKLKDGPVIPNTGAVVSQDGKILMAMAIGKPTRPQQFIFEQDSWTNSSEEFYIWNNQSPVMLKTDGSVLFQVGVEGPTVMEQRNITRFYSFESDSTWGAAFPYPTTHFTYLPRGSHKAVWSDYLESAVFYGGSNMMIRGTEPYSPDMLKLYHPRSKEWTWKPTKGHNAHYFSHCVAITDDGKKLFVYGGDSTEPRDDFAMLDLETLQWSKPVQKGPGRENTVCAVAGDYFLLWGGEVPGNNTSTIYDAGQSSTPVFIYQISTQQWVEDYTPSDFYTSPLPTSSTPSTPSTSSTSPTSSPRGENDPPGSEDGSESTFNAGYLASGAAGALIAIIIGGLFVWKRKRQRTKHSLHQDNVSVDDYPKSFAADGKHDDQMDDASRMTEKHQMTIFRAPQEGRNGDIGASMSATVPAPAPHYPSWGANFDGTYAFDLSQVNHARSGCRSTSRSNPASSPSPPKWPVEPASTPAYSSSPPSDLRMSRQARNPQGLGHHNVPRQNQEQSPVPGGRRSKERPGPQWHSRQQDH